MDDVAVRRRSRFGRTGSQVKRVCLVLVIVIFDGYAELAEYLQGELCVAVKVSSVQLRECELNYNRAALCSDTRGRQLTSKLIGVLQVHQSSFPTWFRSLLIGQLGTRFEAKGATRVGGARGCRSRNVSRIGMRTR